MSNGLSAFWILAALGSGIAPYSDGLCPRLIHLERELSISRSARSTSVKIMWLAGGSGACEAHRHDPGARELCRWLTRNISWERPHSLPSAMLACYAIKGDPFAQGAFVAGNFPGRTKARNRIEIETQRAGTNDPFPSVRLTIRKGSR